MTTNKKHWYFAFANYVNPADNSLNKAEGTFSFTTNKINQSALERIKNDIQNVVKSNNPGLIINNFQLISLSYLGEMTDDEFNA
ncbi:hypothetical protein ACUIJ0_12085 [Acinetobacter junii]|uniref:hypothetical protein n=1 Tax=Acinetobacter junii TaxID=40215 RepID=UPI00124F67A4|nr:hypothetical protein [Acinetobacter junii]